MFTPPAELIAAVSLVNSLTTSDTPHTYVLRPQPRYLGIGGALYTAGVWGMSSIAGPDHLVNVTRADTSTSSTPCSSRGSCDGRRPSCTPST